MSEQKENNVLFSEMALAAPILKALDQIGYEQPTPIQEKMIPHMLDGRDVIGIAQTGTGKTAAFALPILNRLDLKSKKTQALVLVPTRELAIQVAEAFQNYAKKLTAFQILPIYGGQDIERQLRRLQRGVQVVVGTPGRVMDHLRRGTLKLEQLQTMVLDEADEMLRMGFIDDVQWILEKTPENRQLALFSATMPPTIRKIAYAHLSEAEEIRIASKTTTLETTRQRYWMVSGMEHKIDALTRLLEVENFDGILIFVRTKTATVEVADKLNARGYLCAALNGDMAQNQRERIVEQLRRGKLNILVATDVAARGLDVDRISHVINFDIPYDTDSYVHRIGRTGRAGRSGEAIVFVAPRERRFLKDIEKATRQKIELMKFPSTADINDQRVARFKDRISQTLEREDLAYFIDMIDQYRQENDIPALDIAAALAHMVQGDEPLLLKERPSKGLRGHGKRGDKKSPSELKSRRSPLSDADMERYRIEVGHKHNIQPKNIVGAIANEAGIDPADIGRIDIRESYSTVDMRQGIPRAVWRRLKKVSVAGREMNISKVRAAAKKRSQRSA